MFKNIKYIYFDLDDTLWDFTYNSKLALSKLFDNTSLKDLLSSKKELFINQYEKYNEEMWKLYKNKKINVEILRNQRFSLTLKYFRIDKYFISNELNNLYLEILSKENKLINGAPELLGSIENNYMIGILSNGFKDTQINKIKNSKLKHFFSDFSNIVCSDEVGSAKPDPSIFDYATKLTNYNKEQILYIGDSLETDTIAAMNYGMKSIWFNKDQVSSNVKNIIQINNLMELIKYI